MSAPETKAAAIAVLGGGAWGTALAQAEALAGHEVRLWARDPATVEGINRARRNPRFLSEIALDRHIRATGDLADAVAGAASVLLVTPAQTVETVSGMLASVLAPGVPVVLCAKGIDAASGALLSAVDRGRRCGDRRQVVDAFVDSGAALLFQRRSSRC